MGKWLNKLYVTKDGDKWKTKASRNYDVLKCGYKTIRNGYILPLKKLQSSSAIVGTPFEGGVLSENREFISGHKRIVKTLILRYRICTSKNGWEPEVETGNVAGSVGLSNAILAVWIGLSDNTKYDVLYRVGYSDRWSKWYRGGEKTDHKQFPQLERIELKLEEI